MISNGVYHRTMGNENNARKLPDCMKRIQLLKKSKRRGLTRIFQAVESMQMIYLYNCLR